MKQIINKTMMIICEGTVTEPKYLSDLVSYVQHKALNYKITITPVPPKEELGVVEEQSYKRRPRERKVVKTVANEPSHSFVPEEYKAQPMEYIWKAKEALNIYSEVWAVFDRDEHPALIEAFELAKIPVDSKLVNVAFSSRSFEMWLLLHFELNRKIFTKTLCRSRSYVGKGKKKKKHDEYHLCGEDKGHPSDCKGELCITGYMKENNLIQKNTDIKNVSFNGVFKDNVVVAIGNALSLRRIIGMKERQALEKLDPYTDFDKLVFKLLHIEYDYKWLNESTIIIKDTTLTFMMKENLLILIIDNTSDNSYLFLPEHFSLIDTFNSAFIHVGENQITDPGKRIEVELFDMAKFGKFKPAFLRVVLDSNISGLLEIWRL